jgi:hypothetical protein
MSPRRDVPSADMTTTHAAAAVLLAAAAVLGACNNDDDNNNNTGPASTTTTVVRPSSTEPTTTSPTTTSPSTTTTPMATTATSTTPTTQPPVTTAPPTAPPSTIPPSDTIFTPEEIAEFEAQDRALAEAVARDWMAGSRLFREAQMNPHDPGATERALEYATGPWVEFSRNFLEHYRGLNQRILPTTPVDPTLTVESGPTAVGLAGDEVTILVCEVNPWILVETGTGPAGTDTVINDEINSYRREIRLQLVDGIWKVNQEATLEVFQGATRCEP